MSASTFCHLNSSTGRRRKTILLAIPIAVLLVVATQWAAFPPAQAHNVQNSCYPIGWGYTPPDNEVTSMWQADAGPCVNVPSGQYSQQNGYKTVTGGPSGTAYWYMQHNPDEYTQLSLNGPPCGSTPSYPTCASWSWYGYWQRNPDGWKSEQVNTYNGGPYWHRTGYF